MNRPRTDDPRTESRTETGPRAQLLAGLPVTERRLELAGVSTAVWEGGEGTPLVLLHGQGEFAGVWMRVIPDLVATHRVIIPDLPGHGASDVLDGSLDDAHVLAWVDQLIEQTCSSSPVLVGHLLGGAIAARFAIEHEKRLRRLVLVDSFGLARFFPSPRFALEMIRFIVRPTERSRDRLFEQCFMDLDGLRDELPEDFARLEAYALDRAQSSGQSVALRKLMPQFALGQIPSSDLALIAVPTSLIWGRHDRQVRLSVAEAASDRYGWPLHVIEDAADDPAVEQPEAFLEALYAELDTPAPAVVENR